MRGPGLGARAAGARARARIVGLLARLLPDRALAHRSDRQQAVARALPARGPATACPTSTSTFPRDIREVLIPRVHERYGRDRAALVAAFPTFRARGAIRELGKVLGLPAGEIERVARGADPHGPGAEHDVAAPSRRSPQAWPRGADAPRLRALALAGAPGRAGVRAASPPLPALGRDDRRHQAADRLLPGRARRDGGQADGAVGQGLLRGRRLSEDRPAGAGDALGGGALRGGDRARAWRARSTSRASRSTISDTFRGDPRGRHGRRLSDREPRADAVAAAHAAEEPRGPDDPGRDRAARADPGRGDQPLHRAPPAPARRPRVRDPLRASGARAGPEGARSARSSSRTR